MLVQTYVCCLVGMLVCVSSVSVRLFLPSSRCNFLKKIDVVKLAYRSSWLSTPKHEVFSHHTTLLSTFNLESNCYPHTLVCISTHPCAKFSCTQPLVSPCTLLTVTGLKRDIDEKKMRVTSTVQGYQSQCEKTIIGCYIYKKPILNDSFHL